MLVTLVDRLQLEERLHARTRERGERERAGILTQLAALQTSLQVQFSPILISLAAKSL